MSKHSTETDAEFDARYEAYFSRPDIDGWEVRKVSFTNFLSCYIKIHHKNYKKNETPL